MGLMGIGGCEEVMRQMSMEQEKLLLWALREIYERAEKQGDEEKLVEMLANEGDLVERLKDMLDRQLKEARK